MFLQTEGSLSRHALFVAALLCSFVVGNAGAASNMYIKFEGSDIGGNKEIEILSWSHGFVQPTSPTRGGSDRETQNLSFTKYLDSTTDSFLRYAYSGKQISKATITCYRSDGSDRPVKYLTIEMQHVVISNLSISGGPGDRPVENVSLDYGIVHYSYLEQNKSGSKAVPQSMMATPSLRSGAAPSCSVKLPGTSSALPLQSWSVTKGSGTKSGFSFKTGTSTNATAAIETSQKVTEGGTATLTCGTISLNLSNAKISQVSNANGMTNVMLTYREIE
jgi:type VI secretion system secreted protein Hcp